MARSNRWADEESFDIPLTAMIDVVFNLIIFFLVATTFYSEERDLKVKLPQGTQGEMIARQEKPYVINVREAGVLVVENRILSLEDLGKELAQVGRQHQAKVEIRGDASARHGVIMSVMNLCKQHGITDYALTQRIVKERE